MGTGPANMVMNFSLTKNIAVGPRRKTATPLSAAAATAAKASPVQRRFALNLTLGAANRTVFVNTMFTF